MPSCATFAKGSLPTSHNPHTLRPHPTVNNRTRNAIYSLVLLVAIIAVFLWRRSDDLQQVQFEGETMATTYHITYFDKQGRNFKNSIDSLLIVVNQSINTYDRNSEISRFNSDRRGLKFELPYMRPPLETASKVVAASKGAFDPTVMPLVNAWGFGPVKQTLPDSTEIDSLLTFVGFEKVRFNSDSVWKLDPRTQLDFGGIGQGYGADVITTFLRSKGIHHMFVELGGEGMACGMNLSKEKPWKVGILDPRSTPDHQFFKAYIDLSDRSFTTSGNYFNYREVNGQKFSHTIDPVTGYPAQKAILSASVFASDCATADAWGTAIMVMGHEQAIRILKDKPEIDAFLIYSTPEGIATFATAGISAQLEINP
jgi:thiamine biosynthesis lipoprotein